MSLEFPNVSLSETTLDAFQNPLQQISASPMISESFSQFGASPSSVFGASNVSSRNRNPLYCITVFGFPKERTSDVLEYIGKFGNIVGTRQGKGLFLLILSNFSLFILSKMLNFSILNKITGNWIHIALRDETQQFVLTQRNGAFLDDNTMLGIVSCKEETYRSASGGPCSISYFFFTFIQFNYH